MSGTWHSHQQPQSVAIGWAGWLLAVPRGVLLVLLIFGGLAILLLVRLIERPVWGLHRPWTPHITQFVCRGALVILGMAHQVRGDLMRETGPVVANHSSWLDILALNARKRIYFVSKSEVAGWPGIGWLARATGTVFIRRAAREARLQQDIFVSRLNLGHKLLFFPEGTSTDGQRVLPFKSTLFEAFFTQDLRHSLSVQPVSVIYHAPPGAPAEFYSWWGDMALAPHLLKVLATWRQGSVQIIYHPPVRVAGFENRKELARHCEQAVRSGLAGAISR